MDSNNLEDLKADWLRNEAELERRQDEIEFLIGLADLREGDNRDFKSSP